MQSYLGEDAQQTYTATVTVISDARLWLIPASDFGDAVRNWFPMAMHLLEGLFFGMRNSEQIVGQRQQLLALGALSAGLTHELNNPAAAAVRANARCATGSQQCGASWRCWRTRRSTPGCWSCSSTSRRRRCWWPRTPPS
jgi:hypothetical protein